MRTISHFHTITVIQSGFGIPNLGKELCVLEGNNPYFSPDGKKISTIVDKATSIWDVESGRELYKLEGQVIHPEFVLEGKRIIGDCSGIVRIWDAEIGRELYKLETGRTLVSYSSIDPLYSYLPPVDKRIVTLGGDSIRIVDVETGRELCKMKLHTDFLEYRFSPDGKKVLVTNKDGTARIWNLSAIGEAEARQRAEQARQTRIVTLANATDIKSEILKNGLTQLSDYAQYGSAAVRNLAQGDAFDKAAAQPKIQAAQAEITQKTFVGQYGYLTSDVKVVATAGSFTMTIPAGFAFTTIDEIVFPMSGVTGTKGNADASQIILSVSGDTDGIRELVRNSDNYRAKVWFTNLRARGNNIVADVLKIEVVKVK